MQTGSDATCGGRMFFSVLSIPKTIAIVILLSVILAAVGVTMWVPRLLTEIVFTSMNSTSTATATIAAEFGQNTTIYGCWKVRDPDFAYGSVLESTVASAHQSAVDAWTALIVMIAATAAVNLVCTFFARFPFESSSSRRYSKYRKQSLEMQKEIQELDHGHGLGTTSGTAADDSSSPASALRFHAARDRTYRIAYRLITTTVIWVESPLQIFGLYLLLAYCDSSSTTWMSPLISPINSSLLVPCFAVVTTVVLKLLGNILGSFTIGKESLTRMRRGSVAQTWSWGDLLLEIPSLGFVVTGIVGTVYSTSVAGNTISVESIVMVGVFLAANVWVPVVLQIFHEWLVALQWQKLLRRHMSGPARQRRQRFGGSSESDSADVDPDGDPDSADQTARLISGGPSNFSILELEFHLDAYRHVWCDNKYQIAAWKAFAALVLSIPIGMCIGGKAYGFEWAQMWDSMKAILTLESANHTDLLFWIVLVQVGSCFVLSVAISIGVSLRLPTVCFWLPILLAFLPAWGISELLIRVPSAQTWYRDTFVTPFNLNLEESMTAGFNIFNIGDNDATYSKLYRVLSAVSCFVGIALFFFNRSRASVSDDSAGGRGTARGGELLGSESPDGLANQGMDAGSRIGTPGYWNRNRYLQETQATSSGGGSNAATHRDIADEKSVIANPVRSELNCVVPASTELLCRTMHIIAFSAVNLQERHYRLVLESMKAQLYVTALATQVRDERIQQQTQFPQQDRHSPHYHQYNRQHQQQYHSQPNLSGSQLENQFHLGRQLLSHSSSRNTVTADVPGTSASSSGSMPAVSSVHRTFSDESMTGQPGCAESGAAMDASGPDPSASDHGVGAPPCESDPLFAQPTGSSSSSSSSSSSTSTSATQSMVPPSTASATNLVRHAGETIGFSGFRSPTDSRRNSEGTADVDSRIELRIREKLSNSSIDRFHARLVHVYACATLWHEDETEMSALLTSLQQMAVDISENEGIPHFSRNVLMSMEIHLVMDNAFEDFNSATKANENFDNGNRYVHWLMNVLRALPEVQLESYSSMEFRRRWKAGRPTKPKDGGPESVVTDLAQCSDAMSYGRLLEFSIHGRVPLFVHLKDCRLCTRGKRHSQILYGEICYERKCKEVEYARQYLQRRQAAAASAHQPGGTGSTPGGAAGTGSSLPSSQLIAGAVDLSDEASVRDLAQSVEESFVLTLDGDVQFQTADVERLVESLLLREEYGGVCGRIHPIGDGTMNWMVLYQKYEYLMGHHLQKSAEAYMGTVMCCPGCFTMFRLEPYHEMLSRYAQEPRRLWEWFQFQMGEDRFLCTLLISSGYRLGYVPTANANTYCVLSLWDFLLQRCRWVPSTWANLLDFVARSPEIIPVNESISLFYVIYTAVLFLASFLTAPMALQILATGLSMLFSSMLGVLAFLVVWYVMYSLATIYLVLKEKIRSAYILLFIHSILFGLIMILESVQVLDTLVINLLSPNSLIILILLGVLFLVCLFHVDEALLIIVGSLAYYFLFPTMYLLLPIFVTCNPATTWNTRAGNTTQSSLRHVGEAVRSRITYLVDRYPRISVSQLLRVVNRSIIGASASSTNPIPNTADTNPTRSRSNSSAIGAAGPSSATAPTGSATLAVPSASSAAPTAPTPNCRPLHERDLLQLLTEAGHTVRPGATWLRVLHGWWEASVEFFTMRAVRARSGPLAYGPDLELDEEYDFGQALAGPRIPFPGCAMATALVPMSGGGPPTAASENMSLPRATPTITVSASPSDESRTPLIASASDSASAADSVAPQQPAPAAQPIANSTVLNSSSPPEIAASHSVRRRLMEVEGTPIRPSPLSLSLPPSMLLSPSVYSASMYSTRRVRWEMEFWNDTQNCCEVPERILDRKLIELDIVRPPEGEHGNSTASRSTVPQEETSFAKMDPEQRKRKSMEFRQSLVLTSTFIGLVMILLYTAFEVTRSLDIVQPIPSIHPVNQSVVPTPAFMGMSNFNPAFVVSSALPTALASTLIPSESPSFGSSILADHSPTSTPTPSGTPTPTPTISAEFSRTRTTNGFGLSLEAVFVGIFVFQVVFMMVSRFSVLWDRLRRTPLFVRPFTLTGPGTEVHADEERIF